MYIKHYRLRAREHISPTDFGTSTQVASLINQGFTDVGSLNSGAQVESSLYTNPCVTARFKIVWCKKRTLAPGGRFVVNNNVNRAFTVNPETWPRLTTNTLTAYYCNRGGEFDIMQIYGGPVNDSLDATNVFIPSVKLSWSETWRYDFRQAPAYTMTSIYGNGFPTPVGAAQQVNKFTGTVQSIVSA
jgi:hypothetical protein